MAYKMENYVHKFIHQNIKTLYAFLQLLFAFSVQLGSGTPQKAGKPQEFSWWWNNPHSQPDLRLSLLPSLRRRGGLSFITGKGGTFRLSSGWGSLSEDTGDAESSSSFSRSETKVLIAEKTSREWEVRAHVNWEKQ